MKEHFDITKRFSSQSNNLLKLQQFCADFIAKSPEKIFNSLYFTSLPEKILIQIIKSDDLQMKEIEIWEHVLKWGLAQNPNLMQDPNTWSDDDFKIMENTLQHCLPLIRFFSLSSKEFLKKVGPYKKLINRQLYENLLNSYMDPESEPNESILPPRNIKTADEIIDSKIINLNIVSTISRWIDKVDINSKFAHFRELYLPYKFKLLLRGSRDGFTPKKFHELCNNISYTVIFIKVKETEEIVGGYNPLVWKKLPILVTDYEALANKFMPELVGKEIEDFKFNTWHITDWSQLEKKITGPEFEVGGWNWYVRLYFNK